MTPMLRTGLLATALLTLAACAQPTEMPPDPQLELGREIPGFGGLFLADPETPVVYLTDTGEADTARRELAPILARRGLDVQQLRIEEGRYTMVELSEWFQLVRAWAPAVRGVLSVDLDESRQQIHVGVDESIADATTLARGLKRLGLPADAIAISPRAPFEAFQALNVELRPVPGGARIDSEGAGPVCSLGFNVSRTERAGLPVDERPSFVTNSHCTDVAGGVEDSRFGQPAPGTMIGVEVDDPVNLRDSRCPCRRRFLGFCLSRSLCRDSDSARVVYLPAIEPAQGAVGRPVSRGGTIALAGAFRIVGERVDFLVGDTLEKVGAATGWSSGQLAESCVDGKRGSVVYLCQNTVAAAASFGDSGSAVFALTPEPGEVELAGLLWGGDATTGRYIFSPLSAVERELGELTTEAADTPDPGDLADLAARPEPGIPGPQGFCRRDAAGDLLVRVGNQSNVDVLTTTSTRVLFFPGGTEAQVTPPIPAGSFADLTFAVPTECRESDCSFEITVDADDQIVEGDGNPAAPGEVNNIVGGICIS